MPTDVRVKICGLKTADEIDAAVHAGADYIGLNFFQKSPRSVTVEDAARLAHSVPAGVAKVGLVVDVDNAMLDGLTSAVALDIIQLHGHETPERVAEVKARYGLPVMKVVGIADAEDLAALESYFSVADQILVDTKPPKNADLPGGNGLTFDWRLIARRRWPVPWMLAGGLTSKNVAEAIALTGTKQVDVSSGVETAPGVKNPEMMAAFCAAARGS